MKTFKFRSFPILLGVFVIAACAIPAAHTDNEATAPDLPGYGFVAMTVTTDVPSARHWFLQGMQQAYAFNEGEAVRSFKAALAQDPRCALCAWGVAWQLGPNINATDRGDLREASRYAGLAQGMAGNATPLERALIAAMVVRYPPGNEASTAGLPDSALCGVGVTGKPHPLDVLYAAQLRAIADNYPEDPNVVSLYAEAEMLATSGDWWNRGTGLPEGRIGEVVDRLERALWKNADHTGLNHYLIHAVDAPDVARRAVAAADRLPTLAPRAPHLVHMPAHTYSHVGRYADATRVNQEAISAQKNLDVRLDSLGFAKTKSWNAHNRHFLWFAAVMQGRSQLALETARDMAANALASTTAWGEYQRGLPLLTLVRFERWGDVPAEAASTRAAERAPAMYDYARGVALVRTGQVAEADILWASLDLRVRAARVAAKPGDEKAKSSAEMLTTLSSALQAEIAFARGELDAALLAQRQAVRAEVAMGGEPPLLADSSQLALGELLLRGERYRDAEAAFRADLELQPGSGWALRGLQAAVAAQGRESEALAVQAELARAWQAADIPLQEAPRR
jgi:hypothetical protein